MSFPLASDLFPDSPLPPASAKTLFQQWFETTVSLLGQAGTAESARAALGIGGIYEDIGAANAYIVSLSPEISEYPDGSFDFHFIVANDNSDESTLDAGGGALPLVRSDGLELSAGDIVAGSLVNVAYDPDGGRFIIAGAVISQQLSKAVADGLYAALSGNASNAFSVGVATANQQAARRSQIPGNGVPVDVTGTRALDTTYVNPSSTTALKVYVSLSSVVTGSKATVTITVAGVNLGTVATNESGSGGYGGQPVFIGFTVPPSGAYRISNATQTSTIVKWSEQ